MEMVKRVKSPNGNRYIEIVRTSNGVYKLQQYVTKYDEEEECDYTIRETPDPSGAFGALELAEVEAERLMNLSMF